MTCQNFKLIKDNIFSNKGVQISVRLFLQVFQRRVNGSVDFYRNWTDYKTGFGDVEHEFWLGNEILHRLTSQRNYTLRIDMEDWDNNTSSAVYNMFSISSELSNYTLNVGGYINGTEGENGLNPVPYKISFNQITNLNFLIIHAALG